MADIYEHQAPEKLQDYHPSRVLTLVYQPFALGTIVILAYHESKISTRKRNLIGYILYTISTFSLIVLDSATKGRGGIGPYIGLCAVVASFGLADATVQGGMIGDLSLMCPELVQSFMGGLAVAGALTSALRLITKAAFEKTNNGLRKGAMMFLAISTFIDLLCVMLYTYVLPKLPIVKYYRRKAASEGSKTVSADLAAAGIQNQSGLPLGSSMQTDDDSKNQRLSKKELLIQNIDYAVNLFLIYVCTLSIFPGFLYENTGHHGLGAWYALVLVAMYNFWDLVGRYTPLVKWLKIENRKLITSAVLSRYLLIPAFYFTAKYGDQGWMIMLVSALGLTNGHLTVCIMTIAPKGYKGPEQNALGNLLVIFLLGGIFAGVALDWLWLIGKKNAF
ncbi:equilibrative nucleotide transporter 3 isoform X3 [Arabidopsis lyrata subsp. lyrata]|uniref:equilibrative nucleotide transporter 3 isoform X3 n=1 Tax=Arabidopsis lyrata subsp. lyrata TaxID=81972 RepID=UPI000A29E966|nr:equilibrative nucleotide transporter 3 isoform X3 [Arabidopsis lyrata subsp. lyrata]XP_020876414.1 equilibrative nucleotide transporter 3 isoform X3 [Arabidopsis lyrata subsp. lyrata]|eukprot:XP_020876413.1 equilibrative nucleotide transporter 3 isoform X3 [Arabidopsis lyrata subsp. lyrata]